MTSADRDGWQRDLKDLYVIQETLDCALKKKCRPCCYKLIIYGKGLAPNQRPEACPRFTKKLRQESPENIRSIGLYDSTMQLLTVGDGNFSFSLALAKALRPFDGQEGALTATSHETRQSVVKTYPDAEKILDKLEEYKVRVEHAVDATNSTQLQSMGKFDRIIWNFPCVRMESGADGQLQEMNENKQLLLEFFTDLKDSLTSTGEVHVTHKTKGAFEQWNICGIAEKAGWICQKKIIFDRCLYPGYSNKKVLSKKSFSIWDSQVYVFIPKDRTTIEERRPRPSALQLHPVTPDILDQVTTALLPSTVPKRTHPRPHTVVSRSKKKKRRQTRA